MHFEDLTVAKGQMVDGHLFGPITYFDETGDLISVVDSTTGEISQFIECFILNYFVFL